MELTNLAEHINQLELKLLQTDLTANPALIDELLSGNFEEISSSGEVNSRNDVVNWLLSKDHHIQWILTDFRIRVLADDWVLANYTAQKRDEPNVTGKRSIRTSIWQHQGNHWKMVFHQASRKS